jgi:hypothetical protein
MADRGDAMSLESHRKCGFQHRLAALGGAKAKHPS